MIAKQMKQDDLIVMVSARPSTPSYNPLFERIPDLLTRFFNDHSYLLVLPEQEAGRTNADLLHTDQTPASMTWSLVSSAKRILLRWLEKIQKR